MPRIKVRGGTVAGNGRGLCPSCTSALVREDTRGDYSIRCFYYHSSPIWIRTPIMSCSGYEAKSATSRHEYESIAWKVDTDRKTGKIGFLSPLEWKKAHPGDPDD